MAETSATAPLAFLGVGVLRPFQRDRKNDFANGSGAKLFSSRIGQILGTKANTPRSAGEVPWRTNFGSRLHVLRHLNASEVFADLAHAYVVEALQRWEPNVSVTSVEVDLTSIPKTAILIARYDVVDRAGQVTLADQEAKVSFPLST